MNMTIVSGMLSKAHETDAGFDIHAFAETILHPNVPTTVFTNLVVNLPPNTTALVKPRSGLAFNFGLDTMAGVIDETYSGEIRILMINHGENSYNINIGDKIAQLIILPVLHPTILTTEDSIYNSPLGIQRGKNGFGSSGI